MAAVEVMISGVLYDKTARTARPVMLVGEASLAGLGVGGGPIVPPDQGHPGGPPHPEHPIWPGAHPEHPITLPPQGGRPGAVVPPMPPPPTDPATPKPPTENNGWGWHPTYGWGFFPPQVMPHASAPKPA